MKQAIKSALTRVGARLEPRTIHVLNGAVNYLEVGRWMHSRGFEVDRRAATRNEVFDRIAANVASERVLYLEFGVFKGDSLRYWSSVLRNPAAHLHGFDSFEGLPEMFSQLQGRGHFSTGGAVPEFDDPRICIYKGWFTDTLPTYEPPTHERLIVNVDADLYSSASLVLRTIEPWLTTGDYLYFDELHDRRQELQAFDEFLERTGLTFRLIAASRELTHAAFRLER